MASPKVIVFGPTGAVGSSAALTAAKLGAHVALAMRDTSKSIPGLDAATEKQHGFERVTADLTKPETVRAAVEQSGATRAFFYLQFGSPDGMRATVEALKAGGIELPVFLSSFTVRGDLKKADPADMISYAHSMVEVSLTEVFGANNYIALRPGWFASNAQHWYHKDVPRRELKVWAPDAGVDAIVPKDIGAVGGTFLAKGPQGDDRAIYLYGPTLQSHLDAVKIYIKELGIDAKTTIIDDVQEAIKIFTEDREFPEFLAKSMLPPMKEKVNADAHVFGYEINRGDLGNVEKYTGKKATTFEEWVQENKQKLLA